MVIDTYVSRNVEPWYVAIVWRFGAPPYAIGASTPSGIKTTVSSSEQVKQLSVMHQTCWAYQPEVDTALCQAWGRVSRLAVSFSAAWALEGGKKRGRVQKVWHIQI